MNSTRPERQLGSETRANLPEKSHRTECHGHFSGKSIGPSWQNLPKQQPKENGNHQNRRNQGGHYQEPDTTKDNTKGGVEN